jgi:hypothetical protein
MWVWALRGSRHFEPAAYSVRLHWPHRAELIIVSLEVQPQGLQRCMYGAPAWDVPCACAALSGIAATVTLQLKLPKPLAVRQT